MLEYINNNAKSHIMTIEDPAEFIFEDKNSFISQKEVGSDVESLAEGVKSAINQDPDIIFISELRDQDTLYYALKAAERGHYVIAVMHTADTIQTLDRIINTFREDLRLSARAVLADTLCGVIAQKMIYSDNIQKRILVTELMYVTPEIASLIRMGNYYEIYNFIRTGQEDGMATFNQSLINLASQELITLEAALTYSDNPEELSNDINMLSAPSNQAMPFQDMNSPMGQYPNR